MADEHASPRPGAGAEGGPPPELQLGDDKAERGFVAWYRSLPDDPSIVRFFDRKVGEGGGWGRRQLVLHVRTNPYS